MILQRFIDGLRRRYDWYVLIPIAHRMFKDIEIWDSINSIQYIIENRCSVSRFGDGEFFVLLGKGNSFQKPDSILAERLKQVLTSEDCCNHCVAIPLPLKDTLRLRKSSKEFWGYFVLRYGKEILPYLSVGRNYLDTQLSRFYIIYKNKEKCKLQISMLKQIWDNKDVVIVEGCQSRTGVGNDLYSNARSISRILGPAESAFSMYDTIMKAITENVTKDKLILLSLGMTATVLAYDLSKLGYWAIDIGHLDVEYEWYNKKAKTEYVVTGKYTYGVESGNIVDDSDLPPSYLSQILIDITKQKA